RQPQADDSTLTKMTEVIRQRMTGRVWFVGSNVQTAPQIESGFKDAVRLLDSHLEHRPYVLGARPSFADFGLAAQIYSCWIDPTPGGFISGGFPNVLAWIQRMLWPRIEGDFESWSTLEATLMPFLRGQVGGRFMPWTLANLAALSNGSDQFEVELIDGLWKQKPQKYHAKSLQMLRDKYTHVSHKVELDRILEQAGCLEGLQAYD
ncbi:MAG: glutathione S-transferase family protein, partial [Pseudomonadota bacterium]